MAEEKEVVFGLSNVHYALLNETDGTYETPVSIPGAVKLSMSREGKSSTFYADNGPFWSKDTNAGYSGTIEVAKVADQFLIDVLGYIKDTGGVLLEPITAKQKPFALLFEVEGNLHDTRYAFFRCTCSRPENEANTEGEDTTPDTQKLDITMLAQEFQYGEEKQKFVKGQVRNDEEGAEVYAKYFKAVVPPAHE